MSIVTDGYEFKLYLEGIRVPFISARLDFNSYISTASVELFSSAKFSLIPSSTLVHIFFKRLGLKEKYKLLFFGSVSGKQISMSGGTRNVMLMAYGRAAILNSIIISSVLDADGKVTTKSSVMHKEAASSDVQSALGVGTTRTAAQLDEDSAIAASKDAALAKEHYTGNAYLLNITNVGSTAASGDSQQIEENYQGSSPSSNIAGKLAAIANPNVIRTLFNDLIKDACYTSSLFNKISYDHRLLLAQHIEELPATWANYVANIGPAAQTHMQRYFTSLLNNSLSGTTMLSQLVEAVLGMFLSDMYDIPGLAKAGCIISPSYIASDIPTCNMIFESEKTQVNFSDADANRITRLITFGHPLQGPGNLEKEGDPYKNNPAQNVCMYPDLIKFAEEAARAKKKPMFNAAQSFMVTDEQFVGSRPKPMPMPPDYSISSIRPGIMQDLTEDLFFKLKDMHKNLNIAAKFLPNLVPGQRAILFDSQFPMIFKITGITHTISDSSLSTQIATSNAELLSQAHIRHPYWYDPDYKPDQIHKIYKRYFGCTSMTESAGANGNLAEAYKLMSERYASCEIKSYMSEMLTKRHFDTEDAVFDMLGAKPKQKHDSKGVIIYEAQVFKEMLYDGYDLLGEPTALKSDRQGPVLDYIKTIYGVIGDLHD